LALRDLQREVPDGPSDLHSGVCAGGQCWHRISSCDDELCARLDLQYQRENMIEKPEGGFIVRWKIHPASKDHAVRNSISPWGRGRKTDPHGNKVNRFTCPAQVVNRALIDR